jgi:hypothetical protein
MFTPLVYTILAVTPIYYFFKSIYYLTIKIYEDVKNIKIITDIIKDNITAIAFSLTFLIVMSGMSYLSITASSIMFFTWFIYLISELSTYFNELMTKEEK